MAGSIKVGGSLWTSASWLFRWVLTRIADEADISDGLSADVREIVDEGLGWLSIDDLASPDRVLVRRWLIERLVVDAEAELPEDLAADRDDALRHLQQLVQMASADCDCDVAQRHGP